METSISRQEFEAQSKALKRIIDLLERPNSARALESKELWDDNDLMNYFRISISTVKRRRKDHTFKAIRIGGRYYYEKKDLLNLRDHFLK